MYDLIIQKRVRQTKIENLEREAMMELNKGVQMIR
jgi:hypothetical protein